MHMEHALHVKFGWDWTGGGYVVHFHCAKAGHKLDAIRASDKVSYGITGEGRHEDGVEWSLTFRSVIVFGRMRVLEDGEASLRLARLLGEKFTQDAAYLDNEVKHAGPRMLIRDLSNSGYRIAEIPCCVAPSAEEGIHRLPL